MTGKILKPPFAKQEISLQDLVEEMVKAITSLEIEVAGLVKKVEKLEDKQDDYSRR